MITVVHSHPLWLPQTETWLFNQVRFLPPEVRSHVACDRTLNLEQFALPDLHALSDRPAWRLPVNRLLRKLRVRSPLVHLAQVARRYGAELVHSHVGTVGWQDLPAVRAAGTRHLVTFYGADVSQLPTRAPVWRRRYRELFARVDGVLCEGPHMARALVELGCPEEKVTVHHLGITVDELPFRPRQWGGEEPLRVLIAATFREKKGIPYALAALGALRREVPLEVTLIGDAAAEEGSREEKRKILEVIGRYALERDVRMLGFQPHRVLLAEAYRHHLFLSPSVTARDGDTEGGAPVSIIEMAATGMPVVSTTHCDIPGIIRDGVTGLLAPERDVPALVDRLRWMVGHPEAWSPMQEAARRHVEAEFDAAGQGRRLAAIYAGVVARPRT